MARLLFLGDIVGRSGRSAVIRHLPALREELNLTAVFANGENTAGGSGINLSIAHELRKAGVDALTLGDHCWDQRGFEVDIEQLDFVCRPANLPPACPGRPWLIVDVAGCRVAVLTLLGTQFMKVRADDPFRAADRLLAELKPQADAIIVEIHAEATSEKVAMGWYLDGRVAAVLGSHTHIPTADGRLLPRGTAYLTDLGMSGPYRSILGRDIGPVVASFLDGMPRRFTVADESCDVRLCGALLELDPSTGRMGSIERFERSISG